MFWTKRTLICAAWYNDTMTKSGEKLHLFIEIVGWYGAVAVVAGYVLVSFELVKADSVIYQLLNLTGALGIVGVSLYKQTYQSAVLNIIWSVVALIALINLAIR